jgi:hypothetical protein
MGNYIRVSFYVSYSKLRRSLRIKPNYRLFGLLISLVISHPPINFVKDSSVAAVNNLAVSPSGDRSHMYGGCENPAMLNQYKTL